MFTFRLFETVAAVQPVLALVFAWFCLLGEESDAAGGF
jgi:hypothetical protein